MMQAIVTAVLAVSDAIAIFIVSTGVIALVLTCLWLLYRGARLFYRLMFGERPEDDFPYIPDFPDEDQP